MRTEGRPKGVLCLERKAPGKAGGQGRGVACPREAAGASWRRGCPSGSTRIAPTHAGGARGGPHTPATRRRGLLLPPPGTIPCRQPRTPDGPRCVDLHGRGDHLLVSLTCDPLLAQPVLTGPAAVTLRPRWWRLSKAAAGVRGGGAAAPVTGGGGGPQGTVAAGASVVAAAAASTARTQVPQKALTLGPPGAATRRGRGSGHHRRQRQRQGQRWWWERRQRGRRHLGCVWRDLPRRHRRVPGRLGHSLNGSQGPAGRTSALGRAIGPVVIRATVGRSPAIRARGPIVGNPRPKAVRMV